MNALIAAVIPAGGFFWQLMNGGGVVLNTGINTVAPTSTCISLELLANKKQTPQKKNKPKKHKQLFH